MRPLRESQAHPRAITPLLVIFLTVRKDQPVAWDCLRFLGHIGSLLVLAEGVCLLCIAVYSEVSSSPRTTEHSVPGATLARLSEVTIQPQAAENAR
jgi:hypothetical protein